MTAERIAARARSIPDPDERNAYVSHACPDPAVAAEVRMLLDDPASTLDVSPAADTSLPGVAEPDRTSAQDAPPPDHTAAHAAPDPTAAPDTPDELNGLGGRYRILRPLGSGGMGCVFLAEQLEPVHREVALKLIRAGTDSALVVQRFEAERQALAVMDHPNIAKVFDAGTTADGLPYFVMERVPGPTLTAYCDGNRLPLRGRLEMFVRVCQAVQHAHQKGVIHRDLKPGNILVADVDGRPAPKVIDFGLAKALAAGVLPDVSLDTGAALGTPLYMAPEQADPDATDVDTRADVYALGAVLYELVCGVTPLSPADLTGKPMTEVLRIIREVKPPPPAAALRAAPDLTGTAAARAVSPARLLAAAAGDIGWVAMKCLEKDRGRRYETANAVALEVNRVLAAEPVSAAPPSRGYRARKFVRRNHKAVFAAAAVAAALVLGIIGTSLGLMKARAEERAARAARTADSAALADAIEQRRAATWALADAEAGRDREAELRRAGDRIRYRNGVAFALRELDAFNPRRAAELLAECPEDLCGWEWRHLHGRCAGGGRTVRVSDRPIHHLAVSHDRTRLAVGIGNPTDLTRRPELQVRDAATLELVRTANGEFGGFPEINFRPDGDALVAIELSVDTARMNAERLPLEQAASVRSYFHRGGVLEDVQRGVCHFGWNRTGRLTATSRLASTVAEVRAEGEKEPVFRSAPHPGPVVCARFSPDDRWLATTWQQTGAGGFRTGIVLWDLRERKRVRAFADASAAVFTPDAHTALLSGSDGAITVWNLDADKEAAKLLGHKGPISALDVHAGGGRVLAASCAADRTVRVWDVAEARQLTTLLGHEAGVTSVQFGPNGKLYSAGRDGTIRVWELDFDGGFRQHPLPAGTGGVAFVDDARAVVNGTTTTLVDTRTGRAWPLPAGVGQQMTWDAIGKRVALSAPGGVRVYEAADFRDGGAWPPGTDVPLPSAKFAALALDPSGKRLFCAHSPGGDSWHLEARDLPSGRLIWSKPEGGVLRSLALAVSPDGADLARAALGGRVEILDAATGTVRQVVAEPKEDGLVVAVRSVAFDPRNRYLAAGSGNGARADDRGEVILWDSAAKTARRLRGHGAMVSSVAFSADGERLVSTDIDFNRGNVGEVKLWDPVSGLELLTLPGARAAAFSRNGDHLAAVAFAGNQTASLRVWTAATAPPRRPRRKRAPRRRAGIPRAESRRHLYRVATTQEQGHEFFTRQDPPAIFSLSAIPCRETS